MQYPSSINLLLNNEEITNKSIVVKNEPDERDRAFFQSLICMQDVMHSEHI